MIAPENSYQHQGWLIRRWRDLWLLFVPIEAAQIWLHTELNWRPMSWSIARGMADVRRRYWFTTDEVEGTDCK
jgi:hypothetical protein